MKAFLNPHNEGKHSYPVSSYMRKGRKRLSILLCCIISASLGCKTSRMKYERAESDRIKECRKLWSYKDLKKEEVLHILLFHPKEHYSLSFFPNFLVGINTEGDTIAILDKEYEGRFIEGDTIIAEPYKWTPKEKEWYRPLFSVYSKKRYKYKNDILCSVKTVYYGRIKE